MPYLLQVGIRDADRPEEAFLPLGNHTEYGDLKFVASECLPEGSGIPGPRLECDPAPRQTP